jgi:hypothetical protein
MNKIPSEWESVGSYDGPLVDSGWVVKDDADVETGEKGRELDERVESRGGERVL